VCRLTRHGRSTVTEEQPGPVRAPVAPLFWPGPAPCSSRPIIRTTTIQQPETITAGTNQMSAGSCVDWAITPARATTPARGRPERRRGRPARADAPTGLPRSTPLLVPHRAARARAGVPVDDGLDRRRATRDRHGAGRAGSGRGRRHSPRGPHRRDAGTAADERVPRAGHGYAALRLRLAGPRRPVDRGGHVAAGPTGAPPDAGVRRRGRAARGRGHTPATPSRHARPSGGRRAGPRAGSDAFRRRSVRGGRGCGSPGHRPGRGRGHRRAR
jgi:hypothetical protein